MLERDLCTQIGHYGRSGTQGVSYENGVFSLYTSTCSFRSVCVSLHRSLCGQATCASMLIIRTNRDEGGRMGYTPCTREGRMKEWKNMGKSNTRHEGNTRELFLLVHTNFHRDLRHFNALKACNTTTQAQDSQLLKTTLIPIPAHSRCTFPLRV